MNKLKQTKLETLVSFDIVSLCTMQVLFHAFIHFTTVSDMSDIKIKCIHLDFNDHFQQFDM